MIKGGIGTLVPMWKVMLCQDGDKRCLDRTGWQGEIKFDGERALITGQGIYNRHGKLVSFPEIGLAPRGFIFDAEIVCATFDSLQSRIHTKNPIKMAYAIRHNPAKAMLFDILQYDGLDIRRLPYAERKKKLVALMLEGKLPANCEAVLPSSDPRRLFEKVVESGGEGIVVKNPESSYVGARSPNWLKVKAWKEIDAKVTGYTSEVREISSLVTERGKVNFAVPESVYQHWVEDIKKNGIEGLVAKIRYLEETEKGLRFPILRELVRS